MAIFFFLVGLEIKRELLEGELSSAAPGGAAGDRRDRRHGGAGRWSMSCSTPARRKRCAAGRSRPPPTSPSPWACSACSATACPESLKIFLLALAIIDDLGAIVVIAIFYTADLSLLALGLASIGIAVPRSCMNRLGVQRLAAYVLVGIYVWACVLESGVHATLAGTIVGLCVPLRVAGTGEEHSLAKRCIHALHPWVAFAIMPAFAFANAGVSLAGLTWVRPSPRRSRSASRWACSSASRSA